MTGVVLMVIGVLLLGAGIVVYSSSDKNKVKEEIGAKATPADTVPINDLADTEDSYTKGLEFEKFIVKKFNTKIYKVKEWTSDKFAEGVFVETNQNPDLLIEFNGYNQQIEFAVECKWRQRGTDKGLTFSSNDQLSRYKAYGKAKGVPVVSLYPFEQSLQLYICTPFFLPLLQLIFIHIFF